MSVEEFSQQWAVDISVGGSYSLPKWFDPQGRPRTFACRTTRVSAYRMMVDVPVVGRVGDLIKPYFRDFGNFEGRISDTKSGRFLLELEMTKEMRETFTTKLNWIKEKQKDPSIRDSRTDARVIPGSPHSILTLSDSSVQKCFIIDMSVSGVAVSSSYQPEIGTPLAVGAVVGRVVRLLPDGFAVQFVEKPSRGDLERLVVRTAPLRWVGGSESAPRPDSGVVSARV